MANEHARNIQDAQWIKTATLPNGDATTSSADFDIGENTYVKPNFELSIEIPTLIQAELDAGESLTVGIASGNTPSPTNYFTRVTISGSTEGADATALRYTLPSNCGRYVKVYFIAAGGAGDMSDKQATIKFLF